MLFSALCSDFLLRLRETTNHPIGLNLRLYLPQMTILAAFLPFACRYQAKSQTTDTGHDKKTLTFLSKATACRLWSLFV